MSQAHQTNMLQTVAQIARQAEVFGEITFQPNGQLICTAGEVDAHYAVEIGRDGQPPRVYLRTANRWLSESIEADLMHTGDKLEELIEDELVELDQPMQVSFEHYRDDDMRYTFVTPLPGPVDSDDTPQRLAKLLLAYQAAFSQLGDMGGSDDD